MAGASLLTLIDDIATLLDDVASMTKVVVHKSIGVLGDDLALNAEQVTGVRADRELPVVWAVAKGSLVNKAILVPAAMLISFFVPWLIIPLLMLGGLFLCFEGAEKILHYFISISHKKANINTTKPDIKLDAATYERKKVRGAIRTDFVLSAEIIVLTLGTVAESPLIVQLPVLIGISLLITFGVYGLVAAIVKLDDFGIYLISEAEDSNLQQKIGQIIITSAPKLMKMLSVVGTLAMFIVGGGILVHGFSFLHHIIDSMSELLPIFPKAILALLLETLTGFIAGTLSLACIKAIYWLFNSGTKG